ncbi:MAG: hypothetical protein O6938_11315 [Gammaproteobacteria bacterium]|nr:hypothetical protein [Gammaproteobacteria bacterium]
MQDIIPDIDNLPVNGGFRPHIDTQRMFRPPSNIMVWPVTNEVDSDARSLMNDATSLFVVMRFNDVPSIVWVT